MAIGSGVGSYSTTAGNNTTVGTISVAEGCPPSNINDAIRGMAAEVRSYANTAADGWFSYGDGDGQFSATYASSTSFTIDGVNVTSVYHAGRRVRLTAPSPGTIYGTIASSSFSTNTSVVVTWDSGSLSNEAITAVLLGPAATNSAQPVATSLSVSSTGTGAIATLTSTDAGASEGPDLDLYRNSASPAASDVIGGIQFNGKDDAGNKQLYARIRTVITDPANTGPSEDGKVVISTIVAGVETDVVTVEQAAAKTGLYVAGVPVIRPLLQTLTASTSASLNFTGVDNTKYAGYELILHRIQPATNSVAFWLRASTDQGANLISTSTYVYGYVVGGSGGAAGAAGSGGDSKIVFYSAVGTAGQGISGRVQINLGTAANDFQATWTIGEFDTANYNAVCGYGLQTSSSVNGFGVLFSSGNIASGTIYVYGIPRV